MKNGVRCIIQWLELWMTHMECADLDPNCFIKMIICVSVLNMTNVFVSWQILIKCHLFYNLSIDLVDIPSKFSHMRNFI